MQKLKKNIHKQVIIQAKKEFIAKGFKDTSMRTIAKNAEVGLSNIYNYFKNKDEIFKEVLSPVLTALEKRMEDHNNTHYITTDVFTSEQYLREMIDYFVDLVKHYKTELKLLLLQSHSSELENFKDEYIDRSTETGIEYIKRMKEKYPEINGELSKFFIHTMSSWWISIISELVSHDLSDKEMETFVSEFIIFGTAGWKKIMNA